MNLDINGGGAMKYDFESIMDRRGMDAIAVDSLGSGNTSFVPGKPDEGFDVIPMWVADMNFPACPAIPQAMIRRVNHPAYGYFDIRKEYYDEIIRWHEIRNGVFGLTQECAGRRDLCLECSLLKRRQYSRSFAHIHRLHGHSSEQRLQYCSFPP